MACYGVRNKNGGSICCENWHHASGAITEGNFVCQGTTTYGAVADNGILAYGVAANTTTANLDDLSIYPGGNGVIFRMSYAGTAQTASVYNRYYGTDGTQPDLDNTTQKLVRLYKCGTFPDGTAYCDVEIPDTLCEATTET